MFKQGYQRIFMILSFAGLWFLSLGIQMRRFAPKYVLYYNLYLLSQYGFFKNSLDSLMGEIAELVPDFQPLREPVVGNVAIAR